MQSKKDVLIKAIEYIGHYNDEKGVRGIKTRRMIVKAINEADSKVINDIYSDIGDVIRLKTIDFVGGEII